MRQRPRRSVVSRSAAETKKIGARLARQLRCGDVVLLSAQLGAGKTTLVQGLVKALNVREAALSPTFIIAQTFNGKYPIHHLDFYRLTLREILGIGVQDYLIGGGEIPRGLVLIEWPERAMKLLPKERLVVKIAVKPRSTARVITIAPHGERFENLSLN